MTLPAIVPASGDEEDTAAMLVDLGAVEVEGDSESVTDGEVEVTVVDRMAVLILE